MDSKISLIIICVLFVFVLIFELILSVGSSQINNDVTNLNDDASDALFETTTTSNAINNVLSKTQNLTSTPQNSKLSGNVVVSTEVTVAGNKLYESLTEVNNEITSSLLDQNPLVLESVDAKNTITDSSVIPYPLYTGILFFPGYYLITQYGDSQTNINFMIYYSAPIPATLSNTEDMNVIVFGIGQYPEDVIGFGYVINPNFKIVIYADKKFKNFRGQFCNLTTEPLCFLIPKDYSIQNGSVIVYYGTKLYNPFGTVDIPEDRLTAEWTDSTFPPIQDLY